MGTYRRNFLPAYEGGRPPEYGDIVRPLARTYDGKMIFFERFQTNFKVQTAPI